MPKRSAAQRNTNGTGYAGDARNDAARRKKLQKKALANETHVAQVQETTLRAGLESLVSSSHNPPSAEWTNILKSVLRNQADWSSSSCCQLYELALDCCEGILEQFPKHLGKDDDDESLLSALLEMVSAADIVSKHPQDYSTSVQQQQLAQRVLELKDRAVRTSRLVVETEDLLVVDHRAHYRQVMRPHAFDFVDDLLKHYFAKNQSTAFSMSPTQRQRILRELGTYQTALPVEYGSGIFVRAMESRMDLLRCLIIGPDGSPYAFGGFFFDICLTNYPNSPPKVQFLTTGGGKYRFNPNLYNEGKVCLSLLGTWSGPGWQPGESTLLQVLVSIQSLILVEQPYFNEPGFQNNVGTEYGTSESKEYNSNIRRYTVDAAILPHLRRIANVGEASPYPEFDDILEKHFALKEHAWKKQLSEWSKEASEEAAQPQQNNLQHWLHSRSRATMRTDMETLCLKCVSAWERRPRKQKARKSHGSNNSPQSLELTNMNPAFHAVEVDGVIEIDLDDYDDNVIPVQPITRAAMSGLVARAPPVASLHNGAMNMSNEVIDLT
jgi:ubiquitin-protein ligase